MKNSGRVLATVAVMAGLALVALFTKDSCVPSVCIIVSVCLIWLDAK